jgi:hypothetical protein
MRLGSTPVVWLKSRLSHLIRSPSSAKTVRLAAAVAYVKKGKNFHGSSRVDSIDSTIPNYRRQTYVHKKLTLRP